MSNKDGQMSHISLNIQSLSKNADLCDLEKNMLLMCTVESKNFKKWKYVLKYE